MTVIHMFQRKPDYILMCDETLDELGKCYMNRDAKAVRDIFGVRLDERVFNALPFEDFVKVITTDITSQIVK